jgi:hypothetical protein
MKARVEYENGRFHIRPISIGAYAVSFKTKTEADYVACAINIAFERGQEDVRSALRYLIGAAKTTRVEED